jgi:hypothetical protein
MSVWRWPLPTGASSIVALAVGLFFDGWIDVLCWLGLSVPVVQSIWYWKLR